MMLCRVTGKAGRVCRRRFRSRGVATGASCILLGLLSTASWAEIQPTSNHWQPVDQSVGDLDSLSTSLRRMEPGLLLQGEQTRLFQVVDPLGVDTPYFYRMGAGFRARIDRPQYLVVSKQSNGRMDLDLNVTPYRAGQFLELVPLGTVWEIGLPDDDTGSLAARANAAHVEATSKKVTESWWDGGPIDYRLPVGRVDHRVMGVRADARQAPPLFLNQQVPRRRRLSPLAAAPGSETPAVELVPTASPLRSREDGRPPPDGGRVTWKADAPGAWARMAWADASGLPPQGLVVDESHAGGVSSDQRDDAGLRHGQ